MKVIALIFISCLFFTFSSAQLITKGDPIAPKTQCKILDKKRNKKKRKKLFSGEKAEVKRIYHAMDVISPERLARERAEREAEKQQAMESPELKEDELLASANTELKFSSFDDENAPEIDLNNLPPPINEKHAKVREVVLDMIKKGKADQPITESLYFITAMDEFAYVDFEPFLMAVEFALQGKMVLVEGHTDSRGNDDYNLDLSMKRVRQIERLMLEIGVPQDRISVIGYGETMPTHDNSTNEGRQKNRRVDFKIY